jgi:hypothetical protein
MSRLSPNFPVKELGISTTSLADKLGMHQSSVSRAVESGQRLVSEQHLLFDVEEVSEERASVYAS